MTKHQAWQKAHAMEWFRATVKYRCGFCNAEKTA